MKRAGFDWVSTPEGGQSSLTSTAGHQTRLRSVEPIAEAMKPWNAEGLSADRSLDMYRHGDFPPQKRQRPSAWPGLWSRKHGGQGGNRTPDTGFSRRLASDYLV